MKINAFIKLLLLAIGLYSCSSSNQEYLKITPQTLKDKIAGGWAGKMIGVTYGAPIEFKACGFIYNDTINWKPSDIKGSIWQDDLYVQLTFLMSMDKYGIDAPAKKIHEMFAKSGYELWCANIQARKNYYDSIFPPQSGSPEFNVWADAVDFQIEADFIGFMNPGMPVRASEMASKIGHIMNYGDGVYGGMFVGAMYSQAFFESDISKVVENALKSIPAESNYAKIIRDVIVLHKYYPNDWKASWKELQEKWGNVKITWTEGAGNIDAKFNGAYIVMGLLYGNGDVLKTLEITTRCGQDADCNPSNAMAVLGIIKGFSNLPEDMKKAVNAIGDSIFINTNYSFNKAVKSTYDYAINSIKTEGGESTDSIIKIKPQTPVAPALEVSFPNTVFDKRIDILKDKNFSLKGNWLICRNINFMIGAKEMKDQSMYAEKAGDELEFSFTGSGVAILGNWVKDGGKADVYLDGKLNRTFDSYFFYSKQEYLNNYLWHAFNLKPGQHTVKLVVRGEKRAESLGKRIYLTEINTFNNSTPKNEGFKFSFEK